MQKQSISNFIDKTFTILESGEHTEAISWDQKGTSFVVKEETLFERDVLPLFFKHSNLTSFQRQLNMYNFHKTRNSQGCMEYHHRLFRRNHRNLLKAIRRKPSEDQIEIGQELLRKLALEHEETRHQGGSTIREAKRQDSEAPQVESPVTMSSPCFPMSDCYPCPFFLTYQQMQMMQMQMMQMSQMQMFGQQLFGYPSCGYSPVQQVETRVIVPRRQ